MNTNEISGKRQLEFLADFDYIREAGTAGEEKAAERIQKTLFRMSRFLRGKNCVFSFIYHSF